MTERVEGIVEVLASLSQKPEEEILRAIKEVNQSGRFQARYHRAFDLLEIEAAEWDDFWAHLKARLVGETA